MCNVDDSDTGPTPRIAQSVIGAPCVKCGEPGVLITRIHDSFCKGCFQVYTVHKFRSAIGKSKLIRDGETVLVAFSGGHNSAALLHLIQDGLSHRAHKRLRFTPTLIHIDESCLYDSDTETCQQRQDQVRKIMVESGFPAYLTSLEEAFRDMSQDESLSNPPVAMSSSHRLQLWSVNNEHDATQTLSSSQDLKEKLQKTVQTVGSTTALEDFIFNLKRQILVLAARQLGFAKILTAETSTRLAIHVLSDVAQGRGAQVALDTGISDSRNTDVMFMRPVRDLNAKELAMYNNLFGVESVFIPSTTTKTGLASSIERLTQTFVTGLQAEFPSTVSNIVRTSEKLGLPDMKCTEKCSFCKSPLDTDLGKASALGSVIFSQQISKGLHADNNSLSQCPDLVGGRSSPEMHSSKSSVKELRDSLCYGCRLSLSFYNGDVQSLPPFITKAAHQHNIRRNQKEQISEFLIDDNLQ